MSGLEGVFFSLAIGGLLVLVALPLISGLPSPTRWYGYRTQRALSSQDRSHPVNSFAGKYLAVTGTMIIVAGLVGIAARNDPNQQKMLFWISTGILLLGIAAARFAMLQKAQGPDTGSTSSGTPKSSTIHKEQ